MKLYVTLLVLLACVGLVLAQESSTAGEGVAPPAESSGLGEGSLGGESGLPDATATLSTNAVADPLNLGPSPDLLKDVSKANTLPPFTSLDNDNTNAPNLSNKPTAGLDLDIDRRIKQVEEALNRMTWQVNRETAWANSVHDIIQNYQYKYTKVLSAIKKHGGVMDKMRGLAKQLKSARLHEILEAELSRAASALNELKVSSSETSEDAGGASYGALVDRVALLKQDLAKMSDKKVHKVLHGVEKDITQAAKDNLPPASDDTLGALNESSEKK